MVPVVVPVLEPPSGVADEGVLELVDGLLLLPDEDELESVSLTTPSASVTVPDSDDPPELDPVLPVSKESVPETPPEFPVPASFSRVEGFNALFLLIWPFQEFQ